MKIISLDKTPNPQSNSMNRGIHTFTSLLSGNAQFIFLEEHVNRLIKGADFLFPEHKWSEKKQELKTLLESEFVPAHYFRLSICEDAVMFSKKPHEPKQPFVNLGNAKSSKVTSLIPAYVKNGNYLLADLELREATKRKFNDVVFFDQHQNVCEASTSNIFVVVDSKTILTPKTSSMVLDGVTRSQLLLFLKKEGFSVLECDISKSELESSREIWLTNAIQGIRLVESYEKLEMFQEKTIYQSVCHKFGRFGEKFNHE